MILNAQGKPANFAVVTLSSDAIRALVDGRYFVTGMGDGVLRSAAVEPYCARCVAAGGDGHIASVRYVDRLDWHCAHTAGFVRRDRGPLDVEPMLLALGWGLRCPHCKEAVRGDNGRTDAVFRVTCACTSREKVNPVAPPTPALASSPHAVSV